MAKKIVVVNASPRKGWNTDTLLMEAAKGAEAAGAEIVKFDLFKLEKYTGCISCFGCKRERFKGRCICRLFSRKNAKRSLKWERGFLGERRE